MKIKKIIFEMRNDFNAIMECEHCGHEQENNAGYNDDYYHTRVIPEMKCRNCRKSSIEYKENNNGSINK